MLASRYDRFVAKRGVMDAARILATIEVLTAGAPVDPAVEQYLIRRAYRRNLRQCAGCWNLHAELATSWPAQYRAQLWQAAYDAAHARIAGI